MLTNELKKLQQEHHHTIMENNNSISNLTKELNATKQFKLSNSNNYDDFINLNSQLIECSKQNQHLNITLQKLTVNENIFDMYFLFMKFLCLGGKSKITFQYD